MKIWLRAILAVLAGVVVGSIVNMGLLKLGASLIAPPAGVDVTDMESLKASMHLFEPKHFLFPFLAHALGTLVGVFFAALIAPASRYWPACTVGGLFLLGGVLNVLLLPAPLWFSALDLLLAYLPMAWLGRALALRIKPR